MRESYRELPLKLTLIFYYPTGILPEGEIRIKVGIEEKSVRGFTVIRAEGDKDLYLYGRRYFTTAEAMEEYVTQQLPSQIISLLGLTR